MRPQWHTTRGKPNYSPEAFAEFSGLPPLEQLPRLLPILRDVHDFRVVYFMAQKPLKSFDRPLMNVSLSKLILVRLILY